MRAGARETEKIGNKKPRPLFKRSLTGFFRQFNNRLNPKDNRKKLLKNGTADKAFPMRDSFFRFCSR